VAGASELLRAAMPAGPERHGDRLAGFVRGRLRRDPAVFPALSDNGALDGLDVTGLSSMFSVQDARTARTDATGELRKLLSSAAPRWRVASHRDIPDRSNPE